MVSQCLAKKSTFLIYSVPQTRYLAQEYQTLLIWIIYLRCVMSQRNKVSCLCFVTWNYLLCFTISTLKYKQDKRNLHRSDQVSKILKEKRSHFFAVLVGGFCVISCPANSCFSYRLLRLDLRLFFRFSTYRECAPVSCAQVSSADITLSVFERWAVRLLVLREWSKRI